MRLLSVCLYVLTLAPIAMAQEPHQGFLTDPLVDTFPLDPDYVAELTEAEVAVLRSNSEFWTPEDYTADLDVQYADLWDIEPFLVTEQDVADWDQALYQNNYAYEQLTEKLGSAEDDNDRAVTHTNLAESYMEMDAHAGAIESANMAYEMLDLRAYDEWLAEAAYFTAEDILYDLGMDLF